MAGHKAGDERVGAAQAALSVLKAAVVFGLLAAAPSMPSDGAPPAHGAPVARMVINGSINPAVADFVHETIQRAARDEASVLVIQLDTPGGLLQSTRKIVKDILSAPLPVVVYVAPSGAGAGSAGVFITMAAHVAAMAPGTNIGAAHPVGSGGQDVPGHLGKKIENFTAAFGKAIAEQRGRNVEWAVKAVRESVAITEREAVKKHVIDLVARDLADLLRQLDGRQVEVGNRRVTLHFPPGEVAAVRVVDYHMRLMQKVLNAIANPNIAYLLMMAGMLGLYVEFSHPGMLFPGIAGAICLILGLTALQVLPINYTGLILMILGLVLLVAELFVPTFGVLGVGGIVALFFGSLFLFDTGEPWLRLDRAVVFTTVGAVGGLMLFVAYLVFRAQRRQPVLGSEGMVGEVGEVRTRLAPEGAVLVRGEYWRARTEQDEVVEVGERVQVVGVEGLRLRVRRFAPREPRG